MIKFQISIKRTWLGTFGKSIVSENLLKWGLIQINN